MRYTEATIENGYLHSPDLPAPMTLSSSHWQTWLEGNVKFKLIVGEKAATAFKDKRGYWVAQKRVNGKLRQKRLGNSLVLARMSEERLESIVLSLSEPSLKSFAGNTTKAVIVQNDDNLRSELNKLQNELSIMRQGQQVLERKITQLESGIILVNSQHLEEATYTLTKSLELKPNAGGAIKEAIRKALDLIHLSRLERSAISTDRPDREAQAELTAENG